jgi:hypothetical protein
MAITQIELLIQNQYTCTGNVTVADEYWCARLYDEKANYIKTVEVDPYMGLPEQPGVLPRWDTADLVRYLESVGVVCAADVRLIDENLKDFPILDNVEKKSKKSNERVLTKQG